ncbi:hypothetical protein FIBSPDRAFT_559317 [Athelia psychrophila]|uniref:Uncharacterized protein n=1 Tax=Athelia psychrophila TaxID=1759441 RepID=A0A166I976_9AGAM|nr:hypothetical protein FIBSPDRAFT_559317 [Fibularhizoctonia sp. CBS 109695]
MPYKMRETWISRQDVVPAAGLPLRLDYISSHLHPFTTLPQLESHLRPHFAIFEAGRKLAKLAGLNPAALLDALADCPLLDKIITIYAAWIRARPSKVKHDVASAPALPREEPDIEDDAETESWRCGPPGSSQRQQLSPLTPHGGEKHNLGHERGVGKNIADDGGKRKRALSLSGETLRRYFGAGEKMWTSDSILAWSEHTCNSGDSF